MRRNQRLNGRDNHLVVFLLLLGLTVLLGWLQSKTPTATSDSPRSHVAEPQAEAVPRPIKPEGEDFRFLWAILTGVSLGTAILALQTQLPSLHWSSQFLGQAMMWLASLAAVILVYLSVVYGSRLTVGRVDAVETTLLIFVAVAQSSLFVSVALGPGPTAARRWFICLAIFCFFAMSGILSVRRRISKFPPDGVPVGTIQLYRRSLVRDACMAAVLLATAAAYVSIWSHPSDINMLIATTVILVVLVTSNLQQVSTRKHLARAGIM